MDVPYYQINAFTDDPFGGNPAGVCVLDAELPEALMQKLARENDLSETAFIRGTGSRRGLRWFTPAVEVDLCGHATLAAAHALLSHEGLDADCVVFATKSGELTVSRAEQGLLAMDFPARPGASCDLAPELAKALGVEVLEAYQARDLMAVVVDEQKVRNLEPDLVALAEFDALGIIVTAPGAKADFVCRFFAPRAGIDEDPVTGSAHCTLIPYWSRRLGKNQLRALQVSARGGELFCEDRGGRVVIKGRSVTYLSGSIHVAA